MVTIRSVGLMSPTRIEQERCTVSLRCTEQAPHCAMPQPYLVPVRPNCSRSTHNSGVSASTSTSRLMPLMLSLAMSVLSPIVLLWCCCLPAARADWNEFGIARRPLPSIAQSAPCCLRLFAALVLAHAHAARIDASFPQRTGQVRKAPREPLPL